MCKMFVIAIQRKKREFEYCVEPTPEWIRLLSFSENELKQLSINPQDMKRVCLIEVKEEKVAFRWDGRWVPVKPLSQPYDGIVVLGGLGRIEK